MDKRISFVQFQSVKSVAKAVDPHLRNKTRIEAQIEELDSIYAQKEAEAVQKAKERVLEAKIAEKQKLDQLLQNEEYQISALEQGIITLIGFHVTDLVKKVIETDANGKKTTKYLPTSMVSYDDTAKQYVITMPESTIVPPTTEGIPGSDYDVDKGNMPFAPQTENVSF